MSEVKIDHRLWAAMTKNAGDVEAPVYEPRETGMIVLEKTDDIILSALCNM